MSTIISLVNTRIKELQKLIVKDKIELEPWKTRHSFYKSFGEYEFIDDNSEIRVGDIWARTGQTAFMETSFTVPMNWKDEYIGFEFITGGEGLLNLNGKPYAGVDDNRGYIRITQNAKVGETFDFNIEIKTGRAWEYLPNRDNPTEPFILQKSNLIIIDKFIESVYYDFYIPASFAEAYKDELLKNKIFQIIYDAFKLCDFTDKKSPKFREGLAEADEYLKKELNKIDWHKPLGKNYYCGNSHLDLIFLWPFKETERKVGRTYNTLITLMDEYPEYIFNLSQVPVYKLLSKHYPDTYKQILSYIKEGRIEPMGGTYIQNDTNLVSGESLVRQCLYGKRYMKEVLGCDVRVGYLPDVFGYSYALPQIYKKCGIDYFVTTKLSWQDTNKFPYQVFWWEGIDGSKLFTYLPWTCVDYLKVPKDHYKVLEHYEDKLKCSDYLALIGWGDGGGGPTRMDMEALRRMKSLPGVPESKFSKVEDFLDHAKEISHNLPTYNDELYFEYHRGTYTSQARNKKFNRKSELKLRDAEILCVIASLYGFAYPREELKEAWEKVLLNQFHDCIPGTSIAEVYKDSNRDYEKIFEITDSIISKSLETLALKADTSQEGKPIYVFNTLSHQRSDIAEIKVKDDKDFAVYNSKGEEIPSNQFDHKIIFYADSIPSMGYSVFYLKEGKNPLPSPFDFKDNSVSTPFYDVRFNEDGTIGQIYDKNNERNVLPSKARANVLQLFEDKPTDWDAWEIEHDFENRKWEWTKTAGPTLIETGPVRMVLRSEYKTEKSTLSQDIIFYAHKPTIDFKTSVDWAEEHTLFKVAFPVDVKSKVATYEIAFGNIKRSTTNNTSKEQAQFEVSGHRWADLSEPDYGVSILNDCKYGWDIKENIMRLTLLKSPKWPDETCDMGCHEWTYSLFPHKDNSLAPTNRQAHNLNTPLYAVMTDNHKEYKETDSFATVLKGNVIIDCVKPAEDDDKIIIRLYEPYGTRGVVKVKFINDIISCEETNLLEEKIDSDFKVVENILTFYVKPFEIKTFKLIF